jgi:hypothetical protein
VQGGLGARRFLEFMRRRWVRGGGSFEVVPQREGAWLDLVRLCVAAVMNPVAAWIASADAAGRAEYATVAPPLQVQAQAVEGAADDGAIEFVVPAGYGQVRPRSQGSTRETSQYEA